MMLVSHAPGHFGNNHFLWLQFFFYKKYNHIIHTRKSLRMAVMMAHTSSNNRKRYRGYKWWWLINKRITMFSLIFDNSLTFLWKKCQLSLLTTIVYVYGCDMYMTQAIKMKGTGKWWKNNELKLRIMITIPYYFYSRGKYMTKNELVIQKGKLTLSTYYICR